MRVPVRLRVTLIFALVMGVVLALTGLLVYDRFRTGLEQTIDANLSSRSVELTPLLTEDFPPGVPLATPEVPIVGVFDQHGEPVLNYGETPPDGLPYDVPPSGSALDVLNLDAAEWPAGGEEPIILDLGDGEGDSRLLVSPIADNEFLVVGVPLESHRAALADLRKLLWIGLPAALILAALAAYGVAWAALRPVEAMRRRAAEIPLAVDGERLPARGAGGEIARLAETLNEMLGRIETGVERERALVADASHEIRTPLAALQAELELAAREQADPAAVQTAVRRAGGQARRLSALAEGMLLLARVDAGELTLSTVPTPVEPWIADVAEQQIGHLTAAPALTIDAPDHLTVNIDREAASRALGNLITNAARHAASSITITARGDENGVVIDVRDDGPGFPPEFISNAFERFSQADGSRSGGGSGIGLSIARAIAEAHGGSATVRNDGGAVSSLQFPNPETGTSHNAHD